MGGEERLAEGQQHCAKIHHEPWMAGRQEDGRMDGEQVERKIMDRKRQMNGQREGVRSQSEVRKQIPY